MKRLLFILLLGVLSASCGSQKRVLYLQDLDHKAVMDIADSYQIRIKPLDRLTIVVNSKDPELAAPFNTASSYNSLTGNPISAINSTYGSNTALQVRTVDEQGMLDFPILGKIRCAGKTRSELAADIARAIREGGHIADPTVNIQFADMHVSVIGEVARPGTYNITSDRITLLDALSMAGDLTIYAVRDDITVIREENGKRTFASIDLQSKDLFESPYFYLQQNDQIYVRPNRYRASAGEVNPNRSFYISLVSTFVSVATLIITITKL